MLRSPIRLCSALLVAVLTGCASAPELRDIPVATARDYAARQVGDRLPAVKLRGEYQRFDQRVSNGSDYKCNASGYLETHLFLKITSVQGNRFQATWQEVNGCGQIVRYDEEGRFDDQYVYIYNPNGGTTFMNRMQIVDGGAELVPDRYYQLVDGVFTEQVYQARVDQGSDGDVITTGRWRAAAPVVDREAAIQALAQRLRTSAASGREEARREEASRNAAFRNYSQPVSPPPVPAGGYVAPYRPATKPASSSTANRPAASVSRPAAASTTATSPAPAPSSSNAAQVSARSNGNGSGASTSSGGTPSNTRASAEVSATANRVDGKTAATPGAAKNSSSTGAAAAKNGYLTIDSKSADQIKASQARDAVRAREAEAARKEREAAAAALIAKRDAEDKAAWERTKAEMKARGNKQ